MPLRVKYELGDDVLGAEKVPEKRVLRTELSKQVHTLRSMLTEQAVHYNRLDNEPAAVDVSQERL